MGLDIKTYLGVGLTKLRKYAPEVKRNSKDRHQLAIDLWATSFHDAKILATYIEDPKKVTRDQIDDQIKDIDYWDLGDKLVTNVVLKTEFVKYFINKWKDSKNTWYQRFAFILLAEYAYKDKNSDIKFLKLFLNEIEDKIRNEENWVQEAMLYTIMDIGGRTKELNEKYIELGRKLADIEIDYGDTQCETPKILKHMIKEHRQKRIETFYKL